MILLEITFWFGLFLLFYSYIGYPLVLMFLNKVLVRKIALKTETMRQLTVSILIAAYNEEAVIRGKLNNCLALNYPFELLEIYVASDGSLDRTNEIVKGYILKDKRVKLLDFSRVGKANVLNQAMPNIKSEIVIFSDANTEYLPDVLINLVKHFTDEKVGCVCGRLIYRNPGEIVSGKGESAYWRYETTLKKMESRLGYVAGANGAIYAIRRELFDSLPSKTINDDFMISMKIVEKGFKCIYDENAVAFEYVAPTIGGEFKRHIRDGAGHYLAIGNLLGLLNPFLGIRAFIFWSHRILRWLAPFILIVLLLANVFLASLNFYQHVLYLQVLFYVLAISGLLLVKYKKIPFILYVPFYFCSLNLALLIGFVKVISGNQKVTWDRTERL
ncbi:MAG: glycosyltransferase family 2 protein [Candidatus Omnitrophota bacterium]